MSIKEVVRQLVECSPLASRYLNKAEMMADLRTALLTFMQNERATLDQQCQDLSELRQKVTQRVPELERQIRSILNGYHPQANLTLRQVQSQMLHSCTDHCQCSQVMTHVMNFLMSIFQLRH